MTYDNDRLGGTYENKEDLTKHMEKAGRKALLQGRCRGGRF